MSLALKSEVKERFSAIEDFLKATNKLEQRHKTTAKGLAFVQIYAVYEETIRKTVSEAIDSIKMHNHQLSELIPSLMALFLDSELSSVRNSGQRNQWHNRIKLFERLFSGQKAEFSTSNTPLPTDGSHYRYKQLALIFKVFGISRLPVTRRMHIQRIEEVVSHRNSIAHGNDTPEAIGSRYSGSDIRKVIGAMRSVCMLWVRVFDEYCAEPTLHRRE